MSEFGVKVEGEVSGDPLAFFDDAADNAVADEGFMAGEVLPVQNALVEFMRGDVQVSKDGRNVCLNHMVKIVEGEKTKAGATFFNRFYLVGKTSDTQKGITNRLTGFTSKVGLSIPNRKAVAEALGGNLDPLRDYAATFVGKQMIAGIGIDKDLDKKPKGNGITGYTAATPENLAALRKVIARLQGKGSNTKPATASGFKV